ncbi:hypothetical protein [Rubrivirga marina]|uniref:Outer membrane protein beta-barrel domain-containing protein n=1 Tax=Rubrivirga marina TaxID=1196024 RepID=A0A271IVU7_9BACT|nr:hypothetical protein [Rubrivirga marina]PAP75247.1 hypothetical protein BSZ37_01715 [Rubrivirga marina]
MSRFLLASLFVLAASPSSAQTGQRSTVVFADAIGPTGAYALGVERAVWTSAASERQLRLRLGASYWTETFLLDGPTDRVITVPAGASALFALGRPLGVPAAFEFGVGAVFVRRSGSRYGSVGERFTLPAYAEAALRAGLGDRVGLRVGASVGGEASELAGGGVRPVVGVGVGL